MSGFVVSTVSADAPRDVHFSDFSTTDDSNESALPCQQLEPIPDAVVDLGFVPIQQLRVDVRPKTENEDGRSLMAVPNVADDYFSGSSNGFRTVEQVRPWGVLEYRWEAPALCHDPLYFEEINAERYGNSFGDYLQPFVSAGHFYGTIGLLPLKMVAEHPLPATTFWVIIVPDFASPSIYITRL